VKASVLGYFKDPYEQKLREYFGNCVETQSMSIIKASSGLMHFVKDTYDNVADIKTVEVPEEFFNMTFIPHLVLDTGETSTKMSECIPCKKITRNSGTRVLGTEVTGVFPNTGQ